MPQVNLGNTKENMKKIEAQTRSDLIDLKIPKFIADAALILHRQKNNELTYLQDKNDTVEQDPNQSLWRYADGTIEFLSLKARSYCVAVGVFHQLMPNLESEALFEAAYDLWRYEIGQPDSASGCLLALANEHKNILQSATQHIQEKQLEGGRIFEVLQLVEAALPQLATLVPEDVITFIEVQHEATKGDLARGMIFNAIENRLRTEPQAALEILKITKSRISEPLQALYSAAIQALMHTDKKSFAVNQSLEDSKSEDLFLAGSAIWNLGRALVAIELAALERDECVSTLVQKARSPSSDVQQAALRAIGHAALSDERLLSELVQLADKDGGALDVVANFLLLNQGEIFQSSPFFESLIRSLIQLDPTKIQAIHNFDLVLNQLYKAANNRSLVIDCLSQWMLRHSRNKALDRDLIELFSQTFMVIANDKTGLEHLITSWLCAPEKDLASACGSLIGYLGVHGFDSPTFAAYLLDNFEMQDFRLLVRRILGYVIFEKPMLSLTFSLLDAKNAPQRSFGWVHALLTEEIGRDYPSATMAAIKKRQESVAEPELGFLTACYSVLDQRIKSKNTLPMLYEFRPSIRLRRAIALNRSRDFEKASEIANEKSILRQIATQIPVKAGGGSFSFSGNKLGEVNHFQSISHSVSLPMRLCTDPIGFEISGLQYRLVKRGDE